MNDEQEIEVVLNELSDSSASRGWLDCKVGYENVHPRNDLISIALDKMVALKQKWEKQAKLDALVQLKQDRIAYTLTTPVKEWKRELDFIDEHILEVLSTKSDKEEPKDGNS